MYRLLLLCCISTVLTLSAADVAKRDEQCSRLSECATYLSDTSIFGFLPDEEQYKKICRKNGDLQKCFHDNKDDCKDDTVLNKVMGVAKALNFICSAEGKEGLDSISDSPCVNDQNITFSANEEMSECDKEHESLNVVIYIDDSADEGIDCHYLEVLKSCILETLKDKCGDLDNFTKKLVDIYYQPVADQKGCGRQVRQIRTLKSRLVPLILSGVRRRR